MCKYIDICPAYNKMRERCKNDKEGHGECVPLLLEAYHDQKGTNYGDIRKYLN